MYKKINGLDNSARRALVVAVLQQAAPNASDVAALLHYLVRSTVLVGAIRHRAAVPSSSDVAALLARAPAAADILDASLPGRRAIKRAAEIRRPPEPPSRREVGAVAAFLRGKVAELRPTPLVGRVWGDDVADLVARTIDGLQMVEGLLQKLERMAYAVRTVDPGEVTRLELLVLGDEDEPTS